VSHALHKFASRQIFVHMRSVDVYPQVARNVTTNELANWSRYRYMKHADGDFFNPFDRGIR
jgi:hypothetical protein